MVESTKRGRQRLATQVLLASVGLAALAPAAIAQSAAPAGAANTGEEIVVTGRRVSNATIAIGTDEASNTISITRDALLSAPSGVSGLKVLESLPGFNVQANDALGLYEFGNSVFVRAFNFRQIGFVLDGVPMGRSDQFGGSPIFRYVDNENLGRVTASQGAGEVALPSYATLGPIVSYFTIDPSKEFSATAALTFGSDDLSRSFIKLQTGEWNGFSAYLSRSKIDSNLWRGPGTIDREHIEGKIKWEGQTGATVTLQGVYNDFFDFDTPAITKAQYLGQAGDLFGRFGRKFAYLEYVPSLPPLATAPTIPFSNTAHNQYYLQAINQRTDALFALSTELPVSEALKFNFTAYYEDKDGYGVSPEAYATSIAAHNAQRLLYPQLTAPKGLQYGLSTANGTRLGLTGKATYEFGAHTIEAGFWVENDDYHRTQNRFNQEGGNPAGRPLRNEPVHFQRDYESTRDTVQLFLKDTISLFDDRLTLDIGAKALSVDYEISGSRNPADYIARRKPTLSETYEDTFLPMIGAVFDISRTEQVFASWAENYALPQGADDIFSQASPNPPAPQAEESTNMEIGIRTNRPTFNAALSVYSTSFDNRLQAFASPVPGSTTTETFFQNVGGVESHGVELSGLWKPKFLQEKAYFNLNLTYNVAEFKDNFSTFRIAGNSLPDNNEWLAQGGVTIEPTSWAVVNLSARYLSERFTNFTNTEKTDGYTILNAYADFGEGLGIGPLKNAKLRVNVDNLLDEDYLGTITTTISTPATFRPGPPRTVQATLTIDF